MAMMINIIMAMMINIIMYGNNQLTVMMINIIW